MNDHSINGPEINDPQIRSFEARLAAATPQTSFVEQQRLLYQSAFAAGRQTGRKSMRRWRMVSAALVVLLGLSLSGARDRRMLAERKEQPPAPTEVGRQQMLAPIEISVSARQSAVVDLDAWQIPHSDRPSLSEELVQFQQTDPRLRALAVGALSRAIQ